MKENSNKHLFNAIVDNVMKYIFFICSIFAVIVVFSICIFIFIYSLPLFKESGFFKFIFGTDWQPSFNKFGIFPMIVGSLYVTILSTLIGGGFGLFTAIYISMFCPKKLKIVLSQIIDLLAGIPSIVYGFFGMIVLVPFLKNISPNGVGEGVLASSIILGIMILPTITSISRYNLEAVYKYYYDGAVALGSTHSQAIFGVIVKVGNIFRYGFRNGQSYRRDNGGYDDCWKCAFYSERFIFLFQNYDYKYSFGDGIRYGNS